MGKFVRENIKSFDSKPVNDKIDFLDYVDKDNIGNSIAEKESGAEGVLNVSYDRGSGTAFGKWQLSSKKGSSFEEWVELLKSKGGEYAMIAGRLETAKPYNTGSKHGKIVGVYKELAAQYPQLFEETQRESYLKHNYTTAMRGLKSETLQNMINHNRALQEMMFSIAVQHGGTGAKNIFNSVYKEGMNWKELVEAVYEKRPKLFYSSTQAVQNGVKTRMLDESNIILSMDINTGKLDNEIFEEKQQKIAKAKNLADIVSLEANRNLAAEDIAEYANICKTKENPNGIGECIASDNVVIEVVDSEMTAR